MSNQGPPAGWYPDPAGSEAWRWWDGSTWTETLRPYLAAPAAPTGTADEVAAASRLRTIGVPLFILAFMLSGILRAFDTATAAATWRVVTHLFSVASHGGTLSTVPALPASSGLITALSNLVVLPAQIVGIVLLLRFQHRSASTARRLNIPSRLSPTWGVVGWFLPVANFVLPLLAWHGLVSPGHPLRRRMNLFWTLYLASIALELGAYPAAAASTFLASVVIAASLALILAAISMAPTIIGGVLEEHRAASGHVTTSPL